MRVMLFVDGFNVYHSLNDSFNLHQFKWLNYAALGRLFLNPGESLLKTYFFTAYTPWDQHKHNRHETYVSVLKAHGVEPVVGSFRQRTRDCKMCQSQFVVNEEKETDVNIAVYMLTRAHKDAYDVAFLLTGDSDQVPTIKAVRVMGKAVRTIIPVNRNSDQLKKVSNAYHKLDTGHLLTDVSHLV